MTHLSTLTDLFSPAEPTDPAVILPEQDSQLTYRDLAGQIESLAARLCTSLVQAGDAVARELIRLSVAKTYDVYFKDLNMQQVVQWFDLGGEIRLADSWIAHADTRRRTRRGG